MENDKKDMTRVLQCGCRYEGRSVHVNRRCPAHEVQREIETEEETEIEAVKEAV